MQHLHCILCTRDCVSRQENIREGPLAQLLLHHHSPVPHLELLPQALAHPAQFSLVVWNGPIGKFSAQFRIQHHRVANRRFEFLGERWS